MQIIKKYFHFLGLALLLVFLTANIVSAQTNEFTYQGKLSDSGTASATYDFEFRLCAAATECPKPLATEQRSGVTVSGGVFTVKLNFDAANFNGDDRFLEIAVKRPDEKNFTTLDVRQKITFAPYSTRSTNSSSADALSAACVNCITDTQIQSIDGSQITGNVAGSQISGVIPAESVPVGSGNYIQNAATLPRGINQVQQAASFSIDGNGFFGNQVGIGGVAQAGIKLDVTGNSVFRTANGNINFGSPNGETGMSVISTNRADFRFNGSTLKLVAGPGTGPAADTNGIVINTLGNVGIGTITPGNKLDVAGNVSTSGSLFVGNGAGISNGLNVSNGLSVNSGNLFVAGATTLNSGLTVTGDANVSNKITTNSLRVNSGGFSFQTVGGNYQQDICRDTTFGTLGQCGLSSRRFKSDVQTFVGGLNLVNRLRPVTFNWKYNGQPDLGFIAEEVFQIEPLLTTSNDAGELEGVRYKLFSVVLVDAVKQQQAQIERQNEQIKEQRNLIDKQQQQLDALTRLVCSQNPQTEICKEQ